MLFTCPFRQQLLDDGVNLRCRQEAKSSKPMGAFVNFMIKAEQARKKKQEQEGVTMDLKAYRAWQAAKGEEFRLLSEEKKAVEQAGARKAFSDKECKEQEEQELEDGAGIADNQRFATVVDAIGNSRSPYTTEAFEQRIRAKLGQSAHTKPAGFTRYSPEFRDEHLDDLFISDRQKIKDSDSFEYYLQCPLAHPGLCASTDTWALGRATACEKNLHKALVGQPRGSFHRLRLVTGPAWHRVTWVALGHLRGSGPRVSLFASSSIDLTSRRLSIDDPKDGFSYILGISLIGHLIKDSPHDHPLELYWSPAPADRTPQAACASAREIRLVPGWEEKLRILEQQVHPRLDAPAAVDMGLRRMRAGLKATFEPSLKKPRPSGKRGVKVVAPPLGPAPAGAGDCSPESSSEDGGSGRGGSEDGDDGLGALHSAPPPLPPPPAAPLAGDAGPPGAEPPPPPAMPGGWKHWAIGDFGYIVYDAKADSFGAHCRFPGHGVCRANKACARHGLGYLVAFLMHPCEPGKICANREAHAQALPDLRSPAWFQVRCDCRKWLLEREVECTYKEMLDLERRHHPEGSFEEPMRVKH